jgi:hypothetical protein
VGTMGGGFFLRLITGLEKNETPHEVGTRVNGSKKRKWSYRMYYLCLGELRKYSLS